MVLNINKMRVAQIVSLLLLSMVTHAQYLRPSYQEFSTIKGFSIYGMVQAGTLDQPELAQELQRAGSAAPGKWALGLGAGAQYQFRKGTAIRGDFVVRGWGNPDAEPDVQLGSILVDLSVRQQFFLHSVVQPFAVVGAGSLEQNLRRTFAVAPGAGISQTLAVPNTSVIYGSSGFGLVGAGIHFASWVTPTKFLADFMEIEFSYRFPLGRPIWSTPGSDEIPFPESGWNAFSITMKAGLTVRSKRKS